MSKAIMVVEALKHAKINTWKHLWLTPSTNSHSQQIHGSYVESLISNMDWTKIDL